MTVSEIIEKYLDDNGFDGLYRDTYCWCDKELLFDCVRHNIYECKPGHKIPCDCGEHNYHIGEK